MSHTHVPDDFDFAQLRGAFDAPIATSPRFAAQLKEELMSELTASDRIRPASIARASRDKGQISRVQTLTATNWQGALITMAAILTVLALSFASLRYVNNRTGGGSGDDGDTTGITSGQPASATPESAGEGSSDLDGSNYIGTSAKDYADTPILLNSLNTPGSVIASNVIGKYVVRQVRDWDDTSVAAGYIEAVDLNTGESAWTFDAISYGNFTSDGTNVFAWIYTPDTSPNQLIAIDLVTGKQAWHLVDPTGVDRHNWGTGPLYVDGIVYVPTGALSVLAVDAVDGSLLWDEDREEPVDGSQPTQNQLNELFSASIAILGDQLFIAWGGKVVEKLDRQSGETIWTYQIEGIDKDVTPNSDIFVDDQRVYVSITEAPELTPTPDGTTVDSYVIAIDQSEPKQLWSMEWSTAPLLSSSAAGPLFLNSGGTIGAIDKATGQPVDAQYDLDTSENLYLPFASISNDSIFLADERHVFALSTDPIGGLEKQWDLSAQPGYVSVPAATIGEIEPYISSTVELWQNNLIVTTTQGQIWSISPELSTTDASTPGASPIATPEPLMVDAPVDPNIEVNQGGDTGKSWYSDTPILTTDSTVTKLGSTGFTSISAEIVGDKLVSVGQSADFNGLLVFDLKSLQPIWSVEGVFQPPFAADVGRVYVRQSIPAEDPDDLSTFRIAAFSLATGEEVWSKVLVDQTGSDNPKLTGPVLLDGIVYIPDTMGRIAAFDATSGDAIWNQNNALAEVPEGEHATGGSLVIIKDRIYLAAGTSTIAQIDLATGSVIETMEFSGQEGNPNLNNLNLVSNGTDLAVTGLKYNSPEVGVLMLIDLERFMMSNAVQLSSHLAGNAVMSADQVFVPVHAESGELVIRGFSTSDGSPTTGDVTLTKSSSGEQLIPSEARTISLSMAGDTFFSVDSENVFRMTSLSSWDTFNVTTLGEPGDAPPVPVRFLGNAALVLSQTGDIYAVRENPTSSTPEADSLVGRFGPVSPNLADEPELYSANLPTIDQSMSVELFGDILVRATGGNTYIEAVDIVSGTQLWTLNLHILSPIVGDGSSVYVMGTRESGEFGLVAVDLATGQEKWFAIAPVPGSVPDYTRAPIVSDGVVYASNGAATYFAVDGQLGTELWRTDVVGSVDRGLIFDSGAFDVGDSHLFVASTIGMLVALDLSTGEVDWSREFSPAVENGLIEANISIKDETVYVTSTTWTFDRATPEAERIYSGEFPTATAFNASLGEILWQGKDVLAGRDSAIVNDVLLVDTLFGFQPVDLATGDGLTSIKYTNNLHTLGGINVDGDSAYTTGLVGSDLMVFEIDGHEIVTSWRISGVAAGVDSVFARVFSWEDGLLVLAPDGRLYRIAPADEFATPAPTEALVIAPADSTVAPEVQPTETQMASGGDNLVEATSTVEPTPTTVAVDSLAGGFGGTDRSFNMGEVAFRIIRRRNQC